MSRKLTEQQLNSIYSTGGSVLVSAAAGSGKTSVLVERVIRLITREEAPIDVDRLLIVTFTRAAAAEMKERITQALNSLLANDPYNGNLLRQKQLLPNASISTIDSFCSNIVREYFHTLGVASDFRIADSGELEILQNQALSKAFEAFYESDNSDFIKLLDAFSDKSGDEYFRKTVLKVSEFLSTQPFPEKWLDDMLKNYGAESIEKSIWGRIIFDYSVSSVNHAIKLTEQSLALLVESNKLNEKLSPLFENDLVFLRKLKELIENLNWDKIVAHASSYTSGKMLTPRGYSDNPIKITVSANRAAVKKVISDLSELFCKTSAQVGEELCELEALVSVLFDLVKEYIKIFDEHKAKKNILAFSDVEQLAVKLLASPNDDGSYTKTTQGYEISSRYDTVIVDEYQDVNDVQNLIFNCASKGGTNLFVVGDVKQSIYCFREAKPQIFLARKNAYNKYDAEKQNYPATIILDKNFRSRAEICDTVNFIFSHIMSKSVADMDYNEDEMLNSGADYPPSEKCDFEITLIDRDAFFAYKDEYTHNQIEALCIADKIRQMLSQGFQVKDGNSMRNATFGDFAIILRKTSGVAVEYVKTLIDCGIPAYCEEKGSAFDAQEVKILLNILRVINNPTLDIPLLSVLCSPIYGFTPDDLAKIRSQSRKTSLYSSLCKFSENDKKAADFLSELNLLRKYSCTGSVDELIGKVLEITALGAITSAVKSVEAPMQNLNLLRVYARSFESNGCKTLSDFILYIDRLIECGKDISEPPVGNVASLNGVRVISIHKSKGLEFPICILADTAREFNTEDLKKDVILDSEAGLGIKRKSGIRRYKTIARKAIEIEMLKSQKAEEMRVLYVALTRAKEKLIMLASHKNLQKHINDLSSKISSERTIEPYVVSECRCISDWVLLSMLVNTDLKVESDNILISHPLIYDGSCPSWTVRKIDSPSQIADFDSVESIDDDLIKSDAKPDKTEMDYAEILKKNLSFRYRNENILSLPQKVSASQIAHNQNNEYFEKIVAKPNFLSSSTSTALERGTAHHLFLQYCDFEKARLDIHSEINRLRESNRLTETQAEVIDAENLKNLLVSPLFDRVVNSDEVMREERFTVKIKASQAFEECDVSDAYVIMQGAVDLAFVEDNSLVVVDYKTDRVGEVSKLADLYQKQLELYKTAMEQSTGYKVKELIICSIYLNNYITL